MTKATVRGKARRTLLDARFLVGIVLVLGSVAGVTAIVGAVDRTTEVYAAARPLAVGEVVTVEDLVVTPVRLGDAGDRYLSGGALPGDGLVVTRTVGRGELVPASAVGDRASADLSSVVIPVTGQLASGIEAGAVADLWTASVTDDGYGPPSVLVAGAEIVRTVDGGGLLGSAKGPTAVELLVPSQRVARVLQAIANEDSLSLVPVGQRVGS
jgi:hypothetical protein